MKKFLAVTLALALTMTAMVGCKKEEAPATETAPTEETAPATETAPAEETTPAEGEAPADGEKPYIAVISKGFQHQFWQTVKSGSDAAAAKYGVEITFEGPASESDIGPQVDMLNTALAKKPAAICLAALDTAAVTSQLEQAKAAGIPIVGFDSGVPNAPEGSIVATASTDNYAAGALAAESMFKNPVIAEKIKGATKDAPVAIAVQSQDATSESIIGRTQGFIDKMTELANAQKAGSVAVEGHDKYKTMATSDTTLKLMVTIPPTSSTADGQASAQTMLQNTQNLIGYYCSNAGAVDGLLAATTDGTDLDRTNGKFKDLVVVGFDAGANQKNAVKNQYFYGAITQDPYQIGYLAVELAYKSLQGEKVETLVDTGSKFYTYENMDAEDIAPLLYD